MAQKDLVKFLTELDKQLDRSSDEYRKNKVYKLAHFFVLNPQKITNTIKNQVLTANGISHTYLTSGGDKGIKDVYDAALKKLKTDVHTEIVKVKNKHPDYVRYGRSGGTPGPIIQARFLVPENEINIYQRVVGVYQASLNEFYNTFVQEIKSATGKEKLERQSGSSKKMRSQEQAGQVFNLEHAEASSNIEIFINDSMVDALEHIMNQENVTEVDAMLKELENLDPDIRVVKDTKTETVSVFVGDKLTNTQKGGGAEKDLAKNLRNKVKQVLVKLNMRPEELSGSDSLVEARRKKAVKSIMAPFKKTEATVKVEETKIDGLVSKASKTVAQKGRRGKTKQRRIRKQTLQRQKTAKAQFSQTAMLAVINARLPQAIIDNMGPPALNNRTGRFAASVRAINVIQTPQGFPSIGYTYRKSPYATFERGGQQGNIDLDPRKLIDKTIREIAVEQVGRLYTRRL